MHKNEHKVSVLPQAAYFVYQKPEVAVILLAEHIKEMPSDHWEKLRADIMDETYGVL